MPDITAAETRLAGELIQFQVQFATMMLNVGRTGMANDALAKIITYCAQLDEKGITLDA
tara:strand:+ start:108 stop:284 length:177 start_codon:yes stop_codon:yes gene_type:complete